jgi:hypothetical protein
MTGEQLLIVALAVLTGMAALAGALIAAKVLARVGAGMRVASDRLTARGTTLAADLVSARTSLAAVDARAERVLWALGNADDRIDRAMVDIRSKRVSSDTLRVRLIEGRLTVARLRQLVRLMIRLSEMRRAFL